MSSYSIDRRVRCWTCKTNGIDRFFDGNAERQLHDDRMHAERASSENLTMKNTSYRSFGSSASSSRFASAFGSKLGEHGK